MTNEEKLKPYYDRYDKAFDTNDISELAYLNQFANDVDIRKWDRYHICKAMAAKDGIELKEEKQFHLNECGVCLNPNVQSFVSKKCKATIETAMIDGKWYCGWFFSTPVSGTCSGVSKSKIGYDTEKDAIAYIAQRGIQWFSKEKDSDFIISELKKLTRSQPVQLSLW